MHTPDSSIAIPVPLVPRATRMVRFWMMPMLRTRSRRVIALALAIVLMSSVDLYLTLLYVTSMGMNELNPLARAMMSYESPTVLAVWKFATVALCLGILFYIRTRRSAEIGAWVGFLVLGWLMTHWVHFIHETRDLDVQVVQELASNDPTWVVIDAAPRDFRMGRVVID